MWSLTRVSTSELLTDKKNTTNRLLFKVNYLGWLNPPFKGVIILIIIIIIIMHFICRAVYNICLQIKYNCRTCRPTYSFLNTIRILDLAENVNWFVIHAGSVVCPVWRPPKRKKSISYLGPLKYSALIWPRDYILHWAYESSATKMACFTQR